MSSVFYIYINLVKSIIAHYTCVTFVFKKNYAGHFPNLLDYI